MGASVTPARIATLLAGLALAAATPAAAKPFERRLHADKVQASSFLWNDSNKFLENHHPSYVVDDDPATAWIEGAKSSGAREWLRIEVGEAYDKTTRVRLRVRNGYQRSKDLWKANARAKEVTVRLLPSKTAKQVTLTDRGGDGAWVMRTQPKEGPGRVAAIAFGRCVRIPTRGGGYSATLIELMIYDPTGKLVLVAGQGNVEGYRWTMDGGKPMLASVRSMLPDGSILEAKRPTSPAAP